MLLKETQPVLLTPGIEVILTWKFVVGCYAKKKGRSQPDLAYLL